MSSQKSDHITSMVIKVVTALFSVKTLSSEALSQASGIVLPLKGVTNVVGDILGAEFRLNGDRRPPLSFSFSVVNSIGSG
jgi:hypothetical protein